MSIFLHCSAPSAELRNRASLEANAPVPPAGPRRGGRLRRRRAVRRPLRALPTACATGSTMSVLTLSARSGLAPARSPATIFRPPFDNLAEIWTKESLVAFLTAPEEFARAAGCRIPEFPKTRRERSWISSPVGNDAPGKRNERSPGER